MKRAHHFTLTLDWDEVGKRWKLTYIVQLERGVASHWRWIESRGEVDAWASSQIASSVQREMEQWLY